MLKFTYGEEVDDDVEHEDDQGDDGEVDGAVVAHPHCAATHMFEFRLGMHGQTMPMLAECHNLMFTKPFPLPYGPPFRPGQAHNNFSWPNLAIVVKLKRGPLTLTVCSLIFPHSPSLSLPASRLHCFALPAASSLPACLPWVAALPSAFPEGESGNRLA